MNAATKIQFQPVVVRLRDGTEATVRAIREDDADMLQAAIQALSAESRFTRFFSAMPELTPKMLDRAIHPEANADFQLVAVVGVGSAQQIVAGARYACMKTEGDCEFAVAVVDSWQGRGLARLLLETLIREACARGLAHMEGYILTHNAAMLDLAKRLGFVRVASQEDPSVCVVRLDLGSVAS
ncbi:MAG: N-acetyltransferase family protein [Candidatus Binatia bacterium]